MSRVIKFRAWDGEHMHFEQFCQYTSGYGCMFNYEIKYLMQYTGLQDKNGVDIYEGDILKISENINSFVSWNNETCSFCAKKSDHLFGSKFSEVIGNIHQNPDLLEITK